MNTRWSDGHLTRAFLFCFLFVLVCRTNQPTSAGVVCGLGGRAHGVQLLVPPSGLVRLPLHAVQVRLLAEGLGSAPEGRGRGGNGQGNGRGRGRGSMIVISGPARGTEVGEVAIQSTVVDVLAVTAGLFDGGEQINVFMSCEPTQPPRPPGRTAVQNGGRGGKEGGAALGFRSVCGLVPRAVVTASIFCFLWRNTNGVQKSQSSPPSKVRNVSHRPPVSVLCCFVAGATKTLVLVEFAAAHRTNGNWRQDKTTAPVQFFRPKLSRF